MDNLRNCHQVNIDNNDELIVQCLEYIGTNEVKEVKNDNPKSKYKFKKVFEHVIKIYGVTKQGHSISINNNGFRPYFFIKVPDNTSQMMKMRITEAIKRTMDNKQAKSLLSAKFIKRKDFYGFTNNKFYTFIKFTFENSTSMSKCAQVLKDGIIIPGTQSKDKQYFQIYESNIKPFIRFMHTKEIKGAGWIRLKPYSYVVNNGDSKSSTCQIDVDVNYDDVEYYDDNSISQMLIASFDIECSSSHGDFPLAKKNYKKLATEIYDLYKKEDNLQRFNKETGIYRLNEYLNNAFMDQSNIGDISIIYTKDNDKPHPVALQKIAKKVYALLNRQENYKILALDILKYFYNNEYDNISIYKNVYKPIIKSIIEDSFSNTLEDKNNKIIETIYTKTNKKPSKTTIDILVNKCYRQIALLYKKINKSFEEHDYDIDNETIQEIIYLYCKMENEDPSLITQKVVDTYELEDSVISLVINNISFCINGMYSYFEESCPEIDDSRDTYCKRLINKFNYSLPSIEGDKVIQIGTTIKKYGEDGCFLKHIITLNSCSPIEGSIVEAYDNERDVLLAWTKFIQKLDPDIITGYNIFGFDFSFMWHRAEELDCVEEFSLLGRSKVKDKKSGTYESIKKSYLESKKLSSSALGDNILKYITMDGRIMMDLLKIVQKDFNLVSYKLDFVAETFINDKIKDMNNNVLKINGIQTLNVGNYITISYNGDETYCDSKFKILKINGNEITLDIPKEQYVSGNIKEQMMSQKPKWTLAKDDVSPQDIFRLQEGSADDRRIVAIYCIQDCALCINLIEKLKIITNNIGMANVCSVPLSYLFTRGQGVKIFSLVSQQCRKEDFLIPLLKRESDEIKISPDEQPMGFEYGEEENEEILNNNDGYEGAIVLKPKPGIYLKKPVSVLDYASLYPSSMISENLSHDSYIMEGHPDSEIYLGEEGAKRLEEIGYDYVDIPHDVYKWINPRIKSKGKEKCGVKVCRFVQPKDGSKCVIPNKLRELLKARKDTRKLIKFKTLITKNGEKYSGLLEDKKDSDSYILTDQKGNKSSHLKSIVENIVDTYNDFEKSVYDGLQLAFKMTANSLYGQIGAGTSDIYLKDIAASTTATGRKLLYLAKEKVEERFDGAEIVYGDTDSIFIDFKPKDDNGNLLENKAALKKSIEMGLQAEEYIQDFLKPPHKLEYEKTFWPFILFSKKRYIGNKYEFKIGDDDYQQTSMGIVLKRRDNAKIVKHVYGGVINILMNKKNVELSIKFLRDELYKLLDGKFPLDMLIITKSLRGYYKNPESIAHKVLADRMGVRDPGNKPSSNDRIPYAYIDTHGKKIKLQGDRIEHPDFIRENNLKPDYMFYITNQIMKPVGQIYSLIAEDLNGFKYNKDYYQQKYKSFIKTLEESKAIGKVNDLRYKDATDIVFGDVLRVANNRKTKSREITDFFKITKK